MSYHVIGIGGSGAKCIEALTHLSAAGMMPDGDLNILFVDPDTANGSLDRAQTTLQRYLDCRQLALGSIDLFKTNIMLPKPSVWTPFGDNANPTLENFFHYSALKTQNEAAAHLFDILYSPQEKEVVLDEGFLGHPSIGAAVMAKKIKLDTSEPWKTFKNRVELDSKSKGSKIILVGSIFGGTGASGMPTIARLIRKEFAGYENIKIGGVLLLPYFSFLAAEKKLSNGRIFRLDPQNFILNTQAALKYYYNQDYLDCFNSVYLLGEHSLTPVKKPSAGGNSQANDPHFIELYAALAAIDFFKNIDALVGGDFYSTLKYNMVARKDIKVLNWEDLPDQNNGNAIMNKIGNLTQFAFAYLKVYYPMLQDIKKNGKSFISPWYIRFFERKKISLDNNEIQQKLEDMKTYCEIFLKWVACIHKTTDDISLDLVQSRAFSEEKNMTVNLLPPEEFREGDFANLIAMDSKENANGLDILWTKMCDAKVKAKNADDLGCFFNALYKNAMRPNKLEEESNVRN